MTSRWRGGAALATMATLAGCPSTPPSPSGAPSASSRATVPTAPAGCVGLPVPPDARTVFCAKEDSGAAWIAALTPLKEPDKANAELVVVRMQGGKAHTYERNVMTRDEWRRAPWTQDLDGDGHDELMLSVDAPHDGLLRFHDGKVEPYPRPGLHIERFEDANGDGTLHPIFRLASPLAHDCQGERVDLSVLQAGINDGGRLTVDHETVRARLRKTCPAPSSGPFVEAGSPDDAEQRIRCARLRGMSKRDAVAKVLHDCRPFREQATSCKGPCRNLDVLLAVASTDPPVVLSAATGDPDPPTSPAPPSSTATGKLPPVVIQQTVRQASHRFRRCYAAGLRNSPNLQNRVTLRFVIGHDGLVSSASSTGSDMPDDRVIDCVVRATYALTFPKPEGGDVTVTYPIVFSPGQ